jgi:Protein of unknown function (DUF3800)
MTVLAIKPDTLLLFIDETGHEQLSDPNYPIFGMAGCAVMGNSYEQVIREPWRELKAQYFGGPDVPLHAADLCGISNAQMEAIGRFFETKAFSRFASIMKITTIIPDEMIPYQPISGSLMKRVEEIASFYERRSFTIVFESSQRGDTLTARHFGHFQFYESGGQEIPVEWFHMPKSLHESGLEVADFIAHTSGKQVYDRLSGKKRWRKDFECVFRNVDRRLVSYIEIENVKKE